MKIAIITARGGSKRIPRKNIRNFCGKPIIAYSIQAALKAKCFDQVMVSTDDEEIATIAKEYGAEIPFLRSENSSGDKATTSDVLKEVLQSYQDKNIHPEYICCIYPTAPFVTPDVLNRSLTILEKNTELVGVNPIVRFSYPIQRALRFDEAESNIAMFQPENLLTHSQDLEPAYHDAGQFYWIRVSEFLKDPILMRPKTGGIILPEYQVQDIDHEDDWILAEMKYKFIQEKNKELKPQQANVV